MRYSGIIGTDISMAKSLETLLKQKKWSGEDAGQLYLYSTIHDITHNRSNEQYYDALFGQDFFNQVIAYLPYFPEEEADFHFYERLDSALNTVEQTYRYYDQYFWRFYTAASLVFSSIERDNRLFKQVQSIALAVHDAQVLTENLCTTERLAFSERLEPEKYFRTLLSISFQNIKQSLCFFYGVNFTYIRLFTHLDFAELSAILIDMTVYEKSAAVLNTKLSRILCDADEQTQQKVHTYCREIDTAQFKQFDAYEPFVAEALSFSDNVKDTKVEQLQNVCVYLANTMLEQHETAHDQ